MDISAYWKDTLAQDRQAMEGYFRPDAVIRWHCTNEQFTVPEFIRANCEYPGEWDGKIERTERSGDLLVTAVNVYPKDRSASFHVVSFFRLQDGKIAALDEYWGDDGEPPAWRKNLGIGRIIR